MVTVVVAPLGVSRCDRLFGDRWIETPAFRASTGRRITVAIVFLAIAGLKPTPTREKHPTGGGCDRLFGDRWIETI